MIENNVDLFDKYTLDLIEFFNKGTNFSNKEILRYNTHKIRHTIWVLEKWRDILLKMNIQDKKIKNIADISFLLHDIWRFFQNNKKRVLSWTEFEHWDWGYGYIKTHYKKDNNYIIVALAVKYHNKLNIDNIYNEEEYINLSDADKKLCIFITKLLRDADKLQNMAYLLYDLDKLYYFAHAKDSNEVSQLVLDDILNKRCVNTKNVKTVVDYILIYLSWYFDIYFKETIDILSFYWYKEIVLNVLREHWIDEKIYTEIKDVLKSF